jgi:hypothetical protein
MAVVNGKIMRNSMKYSFFEEKEIQAAFTDDVI